jgi:hypothetical protein
VPRGTQITHRRRLLAVFVATTIGVLLACASSPADTRSPRQARFSGEARSLLDALGWADRAALASQSKATKTTKPKTIKSKKKGKRTKTRPKKKAKAKSKKTKKQGGAVTYTLLAKPTTVPVLPEQSGCSTLTVEAFTKLPGGGKGTRTVPFQEGSSTHLVEFSTTFGTVTPNPAALSKTKGTATATLCSTSAGVANVSARIEGIGPKQLARQFKQCQQTKHQGCKRSARAPGPITTTVTFVNKYTCSGPQTTLFDNSNGEVVNNGASAPMFSTGQHTYCLTSITTYHWNDESGAVPGELGLNVLASTLPHKAKIGPWHAQSSSGQNGAPNVNWYVYPTRNPPAVIEGTYSCYDSDPTTWSWNKASGGLGFCAIQVIPAVLTPTG